MIHQRTTKLIQMSSTQMTFSQMILTRTALAPLLCRLTVLCGFTLLCGLTVLGSLTVVFMATPVLAQEGDAGERVVMSEEWHYSENDLKRAGVAIDATSLITVALQHDDLIVRWKALHVLGGRREASAIPALRTLLKDEEPSIQRPAASALIQLGKPEGFDTLRVLLARPIAQSLRLSIASELARFGDASGWSIVRKAATQGTASHRLLAADALPDFVDPELKADLEDGDPCRLLATLADDDVMKVRRRALMNLEAMLAGGCTFDTFEPVLERLSSDPEADLRQRAISLRQRLQPEPDEPDESDESDESDTKAATATGDPEGL